MLTVTLLCLLLVPLGAYGERYYPGFPGSGGSEYTESLNIVGWGPKGILVYMIPTSNPWRPSWGEKLLVMDLVNDAILREESYEVAPEDEERVEAIQQAFREKIQKIREEFRLVLPEPDAALQSFPYYDNSEGQELGVYLEVKEYNTESAYCTNFYQYAYTLWAEKGQGKKQISQGYLSYVISHDIIGYLKHPRENRLAVFILTRYAGLECEHFSRLSVVGCSTSSAGFK